MVWTGLLPDISISGRVAVITGVDKLWGTNVHATDLRAAAALLVAGLMADGETAISNVHHIDRGYENLIEKLEKLGANVKRVNVDYDIMGTHRD